MLLATAAYISALLATPCTSRRGLSPLYPPQGKIMAQGKLLLYGPLSCCEGTSGHAFRGKDLMVFLFEQSIIFSEAGKRKNQFQNPIYAYKDHLQVNCFLLRLIEMYILSVASFVYNWFTLLAIITRSSNCSHCFVPLYFPINPVLNILPPHPSPPHPRSTR